MDNFHSPIAPDRPVKQKKPGIGKRGWLIIAAIVVFALLLAVPVLGLIVSLIGLIAALIGFLVGKLPFLKNRKQIVAFTLVMAVLSLGARGALTEQSPVEDGSVAVAEPMVISSESPSPTPSESPSPTAIADFVGQKCEGDELVMEQGAEKLYCDESAAGVLVWANQDDHDKTILAAKKVAEAKAEKEKVAAEKKASEKAAAEKKVAEKKAAEKAEAKRIAQQEEDARIAEQEAIEEAYVAPAPKKAPSSTYYQNCSAVRAAGAAPIYANDPGYSRKLDRDGDGVACE